MLVPKVKLRANMSWKEFTASEIFGWICVFKKL